MGKVGKKYTMAEQEHVRAGLKAAWASGKFTKEHVDRLRIQLARYREINIAERQSIISSDELQRLYWGENLSLEQIGELIGISDGSVLARMQRYNIPRRSVSAALKLRHFDNGKGKHLVGVDRRLDSLGYVIIRVGRDHPKAYGNWAREHVLVWEEANGPVPKGWVIHHINGDKADNRLENLQILLRSDHVRPVIGNAWSGLKSKIRNLEEENKKLREEIRVIKGGDANGEEHLQ